MSVYSVKTEAEKAPQYQCFLDCAAPIGENAVSHNLILCNMNNLLNQSMMLLGIPGDRAQLNAALSYLGAVPDIYVEEVKSDVC